MEGIGREALMMHGNPDSSPEKPLFKEALPSYRSCMVAELAGDSPGATDLRCGAIHADEG